MHIWIVNHYAIPASESGGTRHYSIGKELVRRGHTVSIFAANFHHGSRRQIQRAETSEAGTDSSRLRFRWIETPSYRRNGGQRIVNMLAFAARVWRAGSHVRELGAPDVVIGSSPHPFAALAACRVAKSLRVPFILEVRDLWPDSLVKVAGASPRHPFVWVLGKLERYLYSTADAIVTLLPASMGHIRRHGGAADRIVCIPNGVDFQLTPSVEPKRTEDTFTVLYAGSHGVANAMDSMLETARLLATERPPIRFRFVGDGPDRPRLRELAASQNLPNVQFDDPIPKQLIYRTLQSADVLLVTTRNIDLYQHGLSFNKLFDYLAAGRPIVFGANCPGNPVEEASAGEVVPPENSEAMAAAIRKLVAMTVEERNQIGLRGRRFAEQHYDIRKLADRFEEAVAIAKSHRRRTSPILTSNGAIMCD